MGGLSSTTRRNYILPKTWVSLEAGSSPEPPHRSLAQTTTWPWEENPVRPNWTSDLQHCDMYRLKPLWLWSGLCSDRMSLRGIISRDVPGQKMQDHLSRAAWREGLWGDSEGRAQMAKGRKGAGPMLQPKCRWPPGSFSSSFPASFPAPAPTQYRSLWDAFEGAALKRANVAYVR